jgi:multicomponent Na+:H+ antiporter subunit B
MKLTAIGLLLLTAAMLVHGSAALPGFGDAASPAASHVSPRYIEAGRAETGANNIVTAVLADYRGYDTLGETVVIFCAGLGCLLIVGGGAAWRARGGER